MKLITEILEDYRRELGNDFESYHNHAQRVYQLSITLLLSKENKTIAIASAFHDLDIWVSNTMDYLKGSEQLAKQYLLQNDTEISIDQTQAIINQHHKIRKFKYDPFIEAFRKADLIDLSAGLIHFNLPRSFVSSIEETYPRHGFTKMITRKVLGHTIKYPRNTFPMLKW
jgi:hypothetical protein